MKKNPTTTWAEHFPEIGAKNVKLSGKFIGDSPGTDGDATVRPDGNVVGRGGTSPVKRQTPPAAKFIPGNQKPINSLFTEDSKEQKLLDLLTRIITRVSGEDVARSQQRVLSVMPGLGSSQYQQILNQRARLPILDRGPSDRDRELVALALSSCDLDQLIDTYSVPTDAAKARR